MLKTIYHFCQGYSHLSSEKPCQDFAYAEAWGDCAMAIVSDGHGGDRYFRSDRGSKFLVEVTAKALKEFAGFMTGIQIPTGSKYASKPTSKASKSSSCSDASNLSDSSCNDVNSASEQNSAIEDSATYTQEQSSSTATTDTTPSNTTSSTTSFPSGILTLRTAFYAFPTSPSREDMNLHQVMQRLFSSIITQWNVLIEKDAKENNLTDWELEHVQEQYKEAFYQGDRLEKVYGATLMAYLQTPKFWMAFQIGDGKLVALRITDGVAKFTQPVPWDDRCFLNKTTSICDSDALNEFRYCYCCNGKFPDAVFLGSDGIDDTYGDGERLEGFYQNIYNEIATDGIDATLDDLRKCLPVISQRGSKDDMSVACVFDDTRMDHNRTSLLGYKYCRFDTEFKEIKDKINAINAKISELSAIEEPSESQRIDLDYAKKDKEKLILRRAELIKIKGQVNQQHIDSLDPKADKKNKPKDKTADNKADKKTGKSNSKTNKPQGNKNKRK